MNDDFKEAFAEEVRSALPGVPVYVGQQTLTLADFLLARIEEDERHQAMLLEYGLYQWHARWCDINTGLGPCDCDIPARVLAECEAKRRIVEAHAGNERARELHHEFPPGYCKVCEDGIDRYDATVDHQALPCPTLRLLALPYADHDDFREEWKP